MNSRNCNNSKCNQPCGQNLQCFFIVL
jgi:hypothetical protein